MQIIPVMDLKDGVVVHGVAGQRDKYQPIESQLACDATPGSVAAALREYTDCTNFYIADLNAIAGAEPDWDAYDAIAAQHVTLMIDSGTADPDRARAFMARAESLDYISGVVVALEALASSDCLPELQQITGNCGIFSLDLQEGQLLTRIKDWQSRSPLAIGQLAIDAGFQRLVVLDLAQVGVNQGVSTHDVCRTLSATNPNLELISGGGVRHHRDLQQLEAAGCQGALVASALHHRTLQIQPPRTT